LVDEDVMGYTPDMYLFVKNVLVWCWRQSNQSQDISAIWLGLFGTFMKTIRHFSLYDKAWLLLTPFLRL